MKIRRLITAALAAVLALSLCACHREPTEEERQQMIEDMGERNRQKQEKRRRFYDSQLHEAGVKYVEDTLRELYPDCDIELSLEPNDFTDATDEELAAIPTAVEEWRAFYSRAYLSFNVNFWDYGVEAEDFCRAMAEKGISGSAAADEFGADRWNIDAVKGTWELEIMPGV